MNNPVTFGEWLRAWLLLTKFRISIASTLTAGTGFIAQAGAVSLGLASTLVGTLGLAMAASTLNEVAESDIDAQMQRTRQRPIPDGRISERTAKLGALSLAATGTAILYFAHGVAPAAIGLLAMFWYNGVYTPMKRVSAFAVVPGSVIGALPPAIGWAAAGGDLESPALLALGFVFFVWQVPHFWLLALRHQEDYERAGLPTLSRYFTPQQIHRLIFTWTAGSVVACVLLWVFQTIEGWIAVSAIALSGALLLIRFGWSINRTADNRWLRRAFMDINLFALALMAAVVWDALV